ncbi:MAG: malectin domain-containing carbohydrate-binding protein [Candidatus Solibacter sp.]|nr:malectin domain-containing carbohydrate-binding protein [Candidatus Solibacter sp.]
MDRSGTPRWRGAGSRLFDVLCNGAVLARDFDIFARAGGSNRALLQTFEAVNAQLRARPRMDMPGATPAAVDRNCLGSLN